MAQGRDLFPADRGLQARMVVASVVTPLMVVVAVVAVALFAPLRIELFFTLAIVIGVWMSVQAYRDAAPGRQLAPADSPQLHALVERLCVAADLPKPVIVRNPEKQPNSWVVARPRRPAELHVTRGLLELLTPAELEAVIAHELAHLAHHDATVMTVVGGPGAVLLEGGSRMPGAWLALPAMIIALVIGAISRFGTNALSRYRELAADAGAAALTGHPAVLAQALRKVSGGLELIPSSDLREVAGRDAFHLLAVSDESSGPWLRRAGRATHPALALRIARLEAMEQRLHAARLPDVIDRP
ncbi:MAG: peptidase Ste24p [Solirubrobacterales bacterium]|jgi:heat shock protein HtpX|nr:peptidase Ste24p [Solirubrobacterales bacterium]